MKKFLSNIPLAFLAAAISCQVETVDRPESAQDTFTAEGVMPARSSISGTDIIWSDDDAIKIFNGVSSAEFSIIDGQGTATGTFQGSRLSGSRFYAVYPYSAAASYDDGVITAAVPSTQYGVADSFDDGINLSVAVSGNHSLLFKNVCGYIRLQVIDSDIYEIVIAANDDDAAMAGTVSVSFDGDDLPQVDAVTDASSSVTLLPKAETSFTPGVYIAAVLPGTYAGGITVTMKKLCAQETAMHVYPMTASKVGSSDLVITRSVVKSVGVVDSRIAWECLGYNDGGLPVGAHNAYSSWGQYVDFQSGRTFGAIGAYNYCTILDACFAYSSGFGVLSTSSTQASTLYNSTNVSAIDENYESYDLIANWVEANGLSKKTTFFEQLSSDEIEDDDEYGSLASYTDLEAVYNAAYTRLGHTSSTRPVAVWSTRTGTSQSYTTGEKLTQSSVGTYYAFKMSEGGYVYFGVLKVTSVAGNPAILKFTYKIACERTVNMIIP